MRPVVEAFYVGVGRGKYKTAEWVNEVILEGMTKGCGMVDQKPVALHQRPSCLLLGFNPACVLP